MPFFDHHAADVLHHVSYSFEVIGFSLVAMELWFPKKADEIKDKLVLFAGMTPSEHFHYVFGQDEKGRQRPNLVAPIYLAGAVGILIAAIVGMARAYGPWAIILGVLFGFIGVLLWVSLLYVVLDRTAYLIEWFEKTGKGNLFTGLGVTIAGIGLLLGLYQLATIWYYSVSDVPIIDRATELHLVGKYNDGISLSTQIIDQSSDVVQAHFLRASCRLNRMKDFSAYSSRELDLAEADYCFALKYSAIEPMKTKCIDDLLLIYFIREAGAAP